MKVGIACDHAGVNLKKDVAEALAALNCAVVDYGTNDRASVDYPDFATLVAQAVLDRQIDRGILICGTGIGMSMTANRYQGVRAAVCTCEYEARMSRAHNDANVLCIGERVVGPGLARAMIEIFINTPFEGGRHLQRVQKIDGAK